MPNKKTKSQVVCAHCNVQRDLTVCEACYEQSRRTLLDEIAKRDLTIIQLTTQLSLMTETVKNTAEAQAAGKKSRRRTA